MLGAQLEARDNTTHFPPHSQDHASAFHAPHYDGDGLSSEYEPAQKPPWLRGSLVIHVSKQVRWMYLSLSFLTLDMWLGMTQSNGQKLPCNFFFFFCPLATSLAIWPAGGQQVQRRAFTLRHPYLGCAVTLPKLLRDQEWGERLLGLTRPVHLAV